MIPTILKIIIGILVTFMSLVGAILLLTIGMVFLTVFSDEEDYSHYPLIDCARGHWRLNKT